MYVCMYVCIGWISVSNENGINFSKLITCELDAEIGISVQVNDNLHWKVLVRAKETEHLPGPLVMIPSILSSLSDLRKITDILDECAICVGNADGKYSSLLASRKRCFYDISGEFNYFYNIHTLH